MTDSARGDEVSGQHNWQSMKRRGFLSGAMAGAIGLGSSGTARARRENDDRPLSRRPFDLPSTYLVFEDTDGLWKAMRSSTQEVEFEGEDGGAVVNDALHEVSGLPGTGHVRVVSSDPDGTTLETARTLEQTGGETGLTLEKGVDLHYTGDGAAIDIAGNGLLLRFHKIVSDGKYCIRDLGAGTSYINGYRLLGASDSLWFADAENARHRGIALLYVNIRWFDCHTADTPYGMKLTDAPGIGSEGHRFDIGSIFRPAKKGLVIGSPDAPADTHSFGTYFVDIDAAGTTEVLAEINDNQNAIILKGYTPARAGHWDIVVSDQAKDSFVTAVGSRQLLRIKRESMEFTDTTKFDPIRHERFEVDLQPDSLDFYHKETAGSGRIDPEPGKVVQHTGDQDGSRVTLSRPYPLDFANLSFENQAALQTNLKVTDNAEQEAWIVWGDPAGQSVGWHIVDDTLEGYVSDGSNSTTVVLEDGFPAGVSWNLTAFYKPPSDVHYYVRPPLDTLPDPTDFTQPVREGVNKVLWPDALASISENLPDGPDDARTAMTMELSNTEAADKQLQWSIWRNHQYPLQGKWNPAKFLRSV